MPTKDYDPINDILETIRKTNTWPVFKVTTDTTGDVFISRGSTNDYVTINSKTASITTQEPVDHFAIRSVLSNHKKNAFSVVWEDGTTTVVHCQSGDEWDDEKALAMCFTKKALGNKGNFNDKFNDALDNRMKVIHAPKSEKEVTLTGSDNIQLTIDDIPTREEINNILAEATKKAEQCAVKASKNLTSMIKELTESPEPQKEKSYELYLIGIFTNTKKLVHRGTINELHDFIKSYATKGGLGCYFRTWNADSGMYLDYGSYSQYFFIPGITNSEYAGK